MYSRNKRCTSRDYSFFVCIVLRPLRVLGGRKEILWLISPTNWFRVSLDFNVFVSLLLPTQHKTGRQSCSRNITSYTIFSFLTSAQFHPRALCGTETETGAKGCGAKERLAEKVSKATWSAKSRDTCHFLPVPKVSRTGTSDRCFFSRITLRQYQQGLPLLPANPPAATPSSLCLAFKRSASLGSLPSQPKTS